MASPKKKAENSGKTPKNGSKSKTNFFDMWREVLIASMNKGQFPIAIMAFVFCLMVFKMPNEDVSKLVFHIFQALENGSLVGYLLACVFGLGWLLHTKWQRRRFGNELTRMADERNSLQSDQIGHKLDSTN